MNTKELKITAEKIIESIFKDIPYFTLRRQAHLAERIYRVTGDTKYTPILKNYLLSIYYSLYRFKEIIGNENAEKTYGLDKINWLRTRSTQIKADRWIYYESNPEMKLYQEVIFILYKLHEYPSSGLYQSKIAQDIIKKLKKINWKKRLLESTLLTFDPVQTINTVWWLHDLGVIDLRDKIVKIFLNLNSFSKNESLTELSQHNYYYGLTHIILCESNYYRNYADTSLGLQIIELLKKSESDILSSNNLDLISEIGITYKLTRQKDSAIEKFQQTIIKNINKETHLLPISKEKEAHFEHAHSLAIVLLYPWNILFNRISLGINESEL